MKHSTVHYLTVVTATAQEINLALPVTMTAIVKNCPKINEVFFLLSRILIKTKCHFRLEFGTKTSMWVKLLCN